MGEPAVWSAMTRKKASSKFSIVSKAALCPPPGCRNRQIVAPMTFKGYCNTLLFDAWVETMLVPALKPGQVVVIDNTSFHQSARTRELIEQAQCRLLFLPPYSPDLNKIEKFWARLKQYLGKTISHFSSLWDAVDDAFRKLS